MPRTAYLPVAVLVLLLATPAMAAEPWPYYELVSFGGDGDWPIGAAIRNWGPTRDVFIAVDEVDTTGDIYSDLVFKWFTCDNASCSTETFHSPGVFVGTTLSWGNALHPSLAIRSLGGSPPNLELQILRREKIDSDCDGDNNTTENIEKDAIDLKAYDWTTSGGITAGHPVEYNGNSCRDTGFSEVRYLGATAHACYTYALDPANMGSKDENVACNNDDTPSITQWDNHLDMAAGSDDEDHPSFDFYGIDNEMAVAGHLSRSGNDRVRVHFPDHTAPPSEPIIYYDGSGANTANHPDIIAANGKLHMVWHDDTDGILYSFCDFSSTVDCTSQSDWLTNEEIVASGSTFPQARFAQMAADDKNQFVVFQFDSDTSALFRTRVVVASRCEGDTTWTFEQVHTPTNVLWDQMIVYGSPSLVLNREDNVAHVLLIEADDYRNGYDVSTIADSDLYWYRQGYTQCP